MGPYSQADHDEAAATGGLMLLAAFVPLVIALIAAIWLEVVA